MRRTIWMLPFSVTLFLCPPVLASAEPQSGPDAAPAEETISLDEAVAEAMNNSPGVGAMEARSRAADQDAKSRIGKLFGELHAVASYSFLNDSQVLRPIAKEMLSAGMGGLPFDRNQFHYGLQFGVPLFMGGKLHEGIKIASLQAEQAAVLARGTRWTVRFNVTSLYTAALSLDAGIQALNEQVQALQHTADHLALMVEQGKRPDIDRLKVVDSLEEARAALADAQARRSRVGGTLLALMGRDPSGRIGVVPVEMIPAASPPSQEELAEDLEQTSSVSSARLQAEQAEHAVRVALSAFIPRVSGFANWMQHAGPSAGKPLNTWALGINLDAPILEGGSRFPAVSAAKARRDAARRALTQARLSAKARLREVLAYRDAAHQQITSAKARVAAGVDAAHIKQLRYDAGSSTVEDLLRARAREAGAKAALALATASLIRVNEQLNTVVEKEVLQ